MTETLRFGILTLYTALQGVSVVNKLARPVICVFSGIKSHADYTMGLNSFLINDNVKGIVNPNKKIL